MRFREFINEASRKEKAEKASMDNVKAMLAKKKDSAVTKPKGKAYDINDPHADKSTIWKKGFADGKAGRMDPKASDAYGPRTGEYEAGYAAGSKVEEAMTTARKKLVKDFEKVAGYKISDKEAWYQAVNDYYKGKRDTWPDPREFGLKESIHLNHKLEPGTYKHVTNDIIVTIDDDGSVEFMQPAEWEIEGDQEYLEYVQDMLNEPNLWTIDLNEALTEEQFDEAKDVNVELRNIRWKAEPGVDLPGSLTVKISVPSDADEDAVDDLVDDAIADLEHKYGYTISDYDSSLEEGYRILPNYDTERYGERAGLEGPMRARNGKVVYYDTKEGKYYDPDTDMYISNEEWDEMNKEHVPYGVTPQTEANRRAQIAGTRAQRLKSPLQKARQDKEIADRDRDGKLREAKKKPVPTKPEKWAYAKSEAKKKFDVYPSAYANAWAAKKYKELGGGWRMGKK